ncbi:MAG: hypothetical protein LUC23_05400 [Prevotellaceae bacterium]|nr:hypothetical protein [Prevotellaceae bacterium]
MKRTIHNHRGAACLYKAAALKRAGKRLSAGFICLFTLFMAGACGDDDKPQNDYLTGPVYTVDVYTDAFHLNQVAETDTFYLDLGQQMSFYVVGTEYMYDMGEVVDTADALDKVKCGVSDTRIGVEQEGEKFTCTFTVAGLDYVVFICSSSFVSVYFQVSGFSKTYYLNEGSYTVEGNLTEAQEEEIRYRLDAYYPQQGNLLTLDYETVQSGGFTLQPLAVTGTFTLGDDNDYTLTGDDWEACFTLTVADSDAGEFYLTQDLTETFQALFPDAEITEVSRTFKVLLADDAA